MVRLIHYIFVLVFLFFISSLNAQEKMEKADEQKHEHEIKPTTVKELDEFHDLLHPLVHDAYPNNDFTAIKKAMPDLIEEATELKKATLPKEFSAKKSAFRKEAKKLLKQLQELKKKEKTFSDETYGKKFMEMHDTFEKMMEMMK